MQRRKFSLLILITVYKRSNKLIQIYKKPKCVTWPNKKKCCNWISDIWKWRVKHVVQGVDQDTISILYNFTCHLHCLENLFGLSCLTYTNSLGDTPKASYRSTRDLLKVKIRAWWLSESAIFLHMFDVSFFAWGGNLGRKKKLKKVTHRTNG